MATYGNETQICYYKTVNVAHDIRLSNGSVAGHRRSQFKSQDWNQNLVYEKDKNVVYLDDHQLVFVKEQGSSLPAGTKSSVNSPTVPDNWMPRFLSDWKSLFKPKLRSWLSK